jgi:polysaccharide export outer membrane protein
MTIRHLVALALLLASPAAAGAQQAEQGSYQIAAGDVLDIVVWRNKDLSMPVVVRPDGFISFPIVNEVRSAGLTPAALAKKIEAGLAASMTSPTVTVMVSRIAGFRVSILGKVRQPGRYEVEATATALDVLALAGGTNDYAQPSGMYVLRRTAAGTYEEIPVKYSSSVSGGKGNTNVTVKPGDIVVVP